MLRVRVILAGVAIVGTIAMHGLAAGHSTPQAIVHGHTQTMHESHHSHAMTQMGLTGSHCSDLHCMTGHSLCVFTLPNGPTMHEPVSSTPSARHATLSGLRIPLAVGGDADRGPPDVSLQGLCVSRT